MLATRPMRRLCVVLSVLLATQAVAAPATSRSWLSGLGVGLVGAGLGLATFGLGQQFIASDARGLVKAYDVPTAAEAASVGLLDTRAKNASSLALLGFVGGAVLLAGGIVALILDTPAPAVAIVPLPGGAALSASLRF